MILGWVSTRASVQFLMPRSMAGEPLAPNILFAELIGVNERAHRAVEDHDPARQDLFEPLADVSVSSRRHRLWITR